MDENGTNELQPVEIILTSTKSLQNTQLTKFVLQM